MPGMAEIDAALEERLGQEFIVWLTTVRADGQPQSVPVWFVWDGSAFLVYSQPDKPKLRNIVSNPMVSLHLRGTETGGDIVVVEGAADRDAEVPPADAVEPYVDKYRSEMAENGWSPEQFAADYSEPIRITPSVVRTW
jgi:PPOX class probable F420-dependent enzyme